MNTYMNLIIGLIGGLGLFIFGMIFMSDALQKLAGTKLNDLISILTNKRYIGVLFGALVTMVVQSSSATTVMTVGFVNAGLLNLGQAIGIIMGSNIGTTITAQLISFNIEVFAPLIIGFSVAFFLIAKSKRTKNIANILIGFGILFLGMSLMKSAVVPLKEVQVFKDSIIYLKNPLVGLLIGLILTAILQSSAATTGLLIAIAGSGLLTIETAFPVVLGSNIGTCVTALIASIGTNKTAKRAAVIHIVIKIIGTFVFMIFLRYPIQSLVEMLSPLKVERQIANAHSLFNIITVIALYPFADQIVKLSYKIIKGEDKKSLGELLYVDERLFLTPDVAIKQIKKEILRMFDIINNQLEKADIIIIKYDEKLCDEILDNEEIIDQLASNLYNFTLKLTGQTLNETQIDKVAIFARTITDLERVGDLVENLAEISTLNNKNKIEFPEKATEEIRLLADEIMKIFSLTKEIFNTEDSSLINEVFSLVDGIDLMSEKFQENHIKRIKKSEYNSETEIVFLDTLSNLERIGDHLKNISVSVSR